MCIFSQKLNSEIEDMEILFKNVSKAFQALVQDLNPDEIERMMWSLKQEKEELVRYRAVIPQKMYLTTQVSCPVLFLDDLLKFLYSILYVKRSFQQEPLWTTDSW